MIFCESGFRTGLSISQLYYSQNASTIQSVQAAIRLMPAFDVFHALATIPVQQWNGRFYEGIALKELGFSLNLGHNGKVCPASGNGGAEWSSDQFVIVDSAGIFTHSVKWCGCNGALVENKHLQLLQCGLFPASITKPQTAFTFRVLDEFLVDALECKTSASSFYMKLKRLTNNAFPDSLPDRYRELMRVSRMWRDLCNRKRAGFGHDTNMGLNTGALALFCPACPQPGINLPDKWEEKYNDDVIALHYVVDGNFTAQHMKMKKPEEDVSLADGLAYMVENEPYQAHVSSALDSKERSTCQNHRAVNDANIVKSNLRATGIGATACARHGCFVPHSVVDFYKGEQQKNMDYSICQAVSYHSTGVQKALVIYDIACQWYTNFRKRVESYNGLSLPKDLEIIPAIGKFHLSAHKPSCFPQYSLMFIKGAGHIDGEVLETLWSSFNKISPSARSMSLSHRQELYDDHMRDSNWKKLVGLVKALLKKYKTALNGIKMTEGPYQDLCTSLDLDQLECWMKDAEKADIERGEELDLYSLQINKAPTLLEMRLNIMGEKASLSMGQGSLSWLVEGISIEDAQDALRAEIRGLPSNPTVLQKMAIAEKRQHLSAKITKFHQSAFPFLAGMDYVEMASLAKDDSEFCLEENRADSEDENQQNSGYGAEEEIYSEDDSEAVEECPENHPLVMPSSMEVSFKSELGLRSLIKEELQLRIGQANDCLEQLRTHLGQKAILYRMNIRSSTSVRTDTRSKQEIHRTTLKINRDIQSYHRARKALKSLGANQDVLQKYQDIQQADLRLSKDITEENRFGQSSDVLPWFWRIEGHSGQSDMWNIEFLRVSWLKARARYTRWKEELEMVRHEMFWITLWFKHQEEEWEKRSKNSQEPGHVAYAEKQKDLWQRFRQKAENTFGKEMLVTM
ncbi:hypothetical protein JVU11DRAFT_4564 [Chiua virens]|nr:hypothetical protein JVU11DRAFT_4564 [Chiua virens]